MKKGGERGSSPGSRSPSPSGKGKSAGGGINNIPTKRGRAKVSNLAANVLKEGSYAERTIWSGQFKGWTRFYVKKPRLPTEADKPRWVDQPKFRPSSFRAVTGTHNSTTIRALQNFVSNFESLKSLQDLTIIHGPSGSGKSMLGYLYMVELAETMDLSSASMAKWALVVDGAEYDEVHGHEMVSKILKFIEPKMEKGVTVPFRVVLVDNFDLISHSNQTTLKKVLDSNLMKLKWILTCRNVKNCIGTIQSKGLLLQTKSATEKDNLLILLAILARNRVGYERQAILRLFDLHRPQLSLSEMLDVLQKAFLQFHFVSVENVSRAFGARMPKKSVSPLAILGEELARCKLCTLVPPCQHQTLDFLLTRAASIRERLCRPAAPGAMVCPCYLRAGYCESFLRLGRCSLAHPVNLHVIAQARRICLQCTVAWPCNHCKYSSERKRLQTLMGHIKRRLELLVEINVPEPPAYLIRKLVDEYYDWRERIAGLASFYLTKDKAAVLVDVQNWIDTAYSSDIQVYLSKQAALGRAFGEIIKSPLLVEPTFSSGAGGGGGTSRALAAGDDESSVLSSLGSLASIGGETLASPPQSPGSPASHK